MKGKKSDNSRKISSKITHHWKDQRTENIAQVFVSYSHAAKEFMLVFRKHLEGLMFGRATIWSDEAIPRGKRWEVDLETQLKSADAALVLVTPDYLASKWCRRELAQITSMVKSGTRTRRVFWILVEPSGWRGTELEPIQSWAYNLKYPLTTIKDPHQRETAIVEVCEDIAREIDALRSDLNDNFAFVREVLKAHSTGRNIDLARQRMKQGQFATVCRGRLDEKDVVIKVLRRMQMEKLAKEFTVYAENRKALTHHCFIKLHNHFCVDYGYEQYIVLVEEYVKAQHLADHLKSGKVSIDVAMLLLRRAAEALQQFHKNDPSKPYGQLTPRNTYYDEINHKLLLPAIGTTNFLLHAMGWERLDSWQDNSGSIAAYIAPEQAPGHEHNQLVSPASDKIDQYMLGQLVFEILEGKLPFTVHGPLDVSKEKAPFWDHPERIAKGTWKDTHPAFANIIFKMLKREPQERWKNFGELLSRLRIMEDESRALAKRSYQVFLGESQNKFFEQFYEQFFSSPHGKAKPEAVKKLLDVGIDKQAEKLREAMIAVLNYYPGNEPTTLSRTIATHCKKHHVSVTDVNAFLESFRTTLKQELPTHKPKQGWDGKWDRDAIIQAWEELFTPIVECFHEEIKKCQMKTS